MLWGGHLLAIGKYIIPVENNAAVHGCASPLNSDFPLIPKGMVQTWKDVPSKGVADSMVT